MSPDLGMGIANPAMDHCLDNGGDVVCEGEGDDITNCVCQWPDGSQCALWDYFHGMCTPVAPKKEKPFELSENMSMALFTGIGIVSLVLLNKTGKK